MKYFSNIVLLNRSECSSEEEFMVRAAQLAVEHGHDPATVIAIAQGVADGEAGREQSFEEYIAEMKAERVKRRSRSAECTDI